MSKLKVNIEHVAHVIWFNCVTLSQVLIDIQIFSLKNIKNVSK